MELFNEKVIIGNFNSSFYGLILSSFDSNGEHDLELGFDTDLTEERIGNNPITTFINYSYSEKLKFTITFVKDNKNNGNKFTDFEIRQILRDLSGLNTKYNWMQRFDSINGETLFYRVILTKVNTKKIGNSVIGIILELECDSPYSYSDEFIRTYNILTSPNNTFSFYCYTDEINKLLPVNATITAPNIISQLTITNTTTNISSIITSLSANEIINLNAEKDSINTSVEDKKIINDFNLKWIKIQSGINTFTVSNPCSIILKYREIKKVGR